MRLAEGDFGGSLRSLRLKSGIKSIRISGEVIFPILASDDLRRSTCYTIGILTLPIPLFHVTRAIAHDGIASCLGNDA